MDLKSKLARLRSAGPGGQEQVNNQNQGQNQLKNQDQGQNQARNQNQDQVENQDQIEDQDQASLGKTRELERLRGLIREVMARPPSEEWRQMTEIDVPKKSLPGDSRQTPFGEVHVAEEHLEPGHCQGHTPLSPALEVARETLSHLAVDPILAQIDPRGMLFLDTETTGLVGGTGTIPFLVGLAWFEDQSLRVEQLFLRELGCERPLLHELTKRIDSATMIVTYNGKTFDWPLLRTRYLMNRMDVPELKGHLDLLHCARRVYKRRLGRLQLTDLEERILGLRREHDVGGAEIPIRYLDYLRSGNETQLVPIIEHNAHDLISLAAVMGLMGKHYERLVPSDEPEDHLSYAIVANRAGDRERALNFARAAGEWGRKSDCSVAVDAWMLIARLERRSGTVEGQERALTSALEAINGESTTAAPVHLALAKLCEHKLKDLPRALHHAELSAPAVSTEAYHHRLERLRNRLERIEQRLKAGGARADKFRDRAPRESCR